MTVLHIITGLSDGGAEAVLYRLVTSEKNVRHMVVSLGDAGKYGAMLRRSGVPVECLGMSRGRVSFAGLRHLLAILRREKPDIVQTWMYHANLLGGVAARLSGVQSIFWGIHHTTLVPGTTGASTRLVDWLCARLSGSVPEGIIACAREAERVHVANGYDAKKFTVIPNGYDLSLFAPDAIARDRVREELSIAQNAVVVGLVGRWDPQKDHANLINAVTLLRRHHPQLHLVLAGTNCDPGNADLAGLLKAGSLCQHVHLLGRRADIPAVMNALDLHVLSSSHGEAFPNVVAEAMACGTPCVVTDVGDAAFIVGDAGWSVPPKDANALAGAIDSALSEYENHFLWASRQAAARGRIAEQFSLSVMVERYQEVWGI